MNYYELIKQELINNEIYKKVKDYSKNRSDLKTYYNVGKMLVEAQGGEHRNEYGNQLIKEYSKNLTQELGRGYSIRNLYNMRLFYLKYMDKEILQTLSAKLSWSHINILFSINDEQKIEYYNNLCIQHNLSVRELKNRIKLNEYERLDNKTKLKLQDNNKLEIQDLVKNPIMLNNNLNKEIIREKVLKQVILEDMDNFLEQLGIGFSYIKMNIKLKLIIDIII